MFLVLMFGTFYGFYLLEPYILYFILVQLVLIALRHAFHWRNWLTNWADSFMTSIDETASSVVGKNLRDTGLFRWKFIEKVVSILLEGGKPHSIPSIEEDEGIKKN